MDMDVFRVTGRTTIVIEQIHLTLPDSVFVPN
jgi:hypothetical protein